MAKARKSAYQRLRELALFYPETHEEFPWGECAIKVRGKSFYSCAKKRKGSVYR